MCFIRRLQIIKVVKMKVFLTSRFRTLLFLLSGLLLSLIITPLVTIKLEGYWWNWAVIIILIYFVIEWCLFLYYVFGKQLYEGTK
jgi:hypothetical protein